MRLIAGLGNPGSRYALTRHNMGFIVLDVLAGETEIPVGKRGYSSLYGVGKIGEESVILAKPQTFMNLSGVAVEKLARFFKIDRSNIIIIHDDMDIPFQELRVKENGGDGGHKGLMSIINHLGGSDFVRVRMGIGRPDLKEMVESFVLSRFSKEEMEYVPFVALRASQAVAAVISSGTQSAMNVFNARIPKKLREEEV
ncbi:MAG: aminoacyl-tRNA hydrolase [Syntrophales bacterium]|nr:aminoacyl-tRNA hydrolase [Syntrophales bacterium]MDY0043476.1 aminoacyl-tRNA hydrolase [Syntrophales bacterium]